MGPLLVKALINFAKACAAAKAAGVEPANIGHGIGMAFGLLIVIVLASICQHQLGPSALAGFSLFLLIIPLQECIMVHQFALRQGSMKWTDERAGRVLEVVASMRVVKYICYEGSFLARLFRIRTQDIALAFSLHVLAVTLAIVTFTETSKQFDVAVVCAVFRCFRFVVHLTPFCFLRSFIVARFFLPPFFPLPPPVSDFSPSSCPLANPPTLPPPPPPAPPRPRLPSCIPGRDFRRCGVEWLNTAEIGLLLTYTTTLTQMFAVSTRLPAEVEVSSIPGRRENRRCWTYGAGKSSLTLCLLLIVEYLGKIIVDGVDIGKIGLTDLRSNIAIIPQEPILFSGMVRTALEPFSKYDDARLWALRRSYLVETRSSTPTDTDPEVEPSGEHRHRLTLDSPIETNGQNLYVGGQSLLSLARALVKDSRVVILDEAYIIPVNASSFSLWKVKTLPLSTLKVLSCSALVTRI
ncbi:hypothetical protein B0H13DRAFT_2545704 [Mycena leptocephala]|nr:hypothetical protein B0H13DRAFT_2545704 [Mycena leptocephala]